MTELVKMLRENSEIEFNFNAYRGGVVRFKFLNEAADLIEEQAKNLTVAREALEFYANHESVIAEAYHSNNEKQITCVHTFINHKAREALKEMEK